MSEDGSQAGSTGAEGSVAAAEQSSDQVAADAPEQVQDTEGVSDEDAQNLLADAIDEQRQVDEVQFDGEFDADRAKTLIGKLRAENKSLKSDRSTFDQKVQAAKSSAEKQVLELQSKLNEAVTVSETASNELWRERAMRKHGLSDDDMEFISGTSEEEILAKAEKYASRVSTPSRRPDPSQGVTGSADSTPGAAFADFLTKSLQSQT